MIRNHNRGRGDHLNRVELADGTIIVMQRHAAMLVMMVPRVIRMRVGVRMGADMSMVMRTSVRMFRSRREVEMDVRVVMLMQRGRHRRQQVAGEGESRSNSWHQA